MLAYVTVTTQNKQVTANYYSKVEPSVGSKALMTQALNHLQQELNLASTNISPEQLQLLFTQAKINLKTSKHQNYDKIGKNLSFFAITFIMYMILIIYSAQTAQEIASEKGTKIMEVIFSSIPADQYFLVES
ncbi:ABC transporter permease [Streptococcus iniae]